MGDTPECRRSATRGHSAWRLCPRARRCLIAEKREKAKACERRFEPRLASCASLFRSRQVRFAHCLRGGGERPPGRCRALKSLHFHPARCAKPIPFAPIARPPRRGLHFACGAKGRQRRLKQCLRRARRDRGSRRFCSKASRPLAVVATAKPGSRLRATPPDRGVFNFGRECHRLAQELCGHFRPPGN